jgi:hypothetical protein
MCAPHHFKHRSRSGAFQATPGKFFGFAMGKPFQEAASSLRQAYEPAVFLEQSSANVDLHRPQD